jgi:hypothetical protein
LKPDARFLPYERIDAKILLVRGHKVMLDADLEETQRLMTRPAVRD